MFPESGLEICCINVNGIAGRLTRKCFDRSLDLTLPPPNVLSTKESFLILGWLVGWDGWELFFFFFVGFLGFILGGCHFGHLGALLDGGRAALVRLIGGVGTLVLATEPNDETAIACSKTNSNSISEFDWFMNK